MLCESTALPGFSSVPHCRFEHDVVWCGVVQAAFALWQAGVAACVEISSTWELACCAALRFFNLNCEPAGKKRVDVVCLQRSDVLLSVFG
jgi:hypothetical protein